MGQTLVRAQGILADFEEVYFSVPDLLVWNLWLL